MVEIQSGAYASYSELRQDGLIAEAEHESFTRAVDLMFQMIASAAAPHDLRPAYMDVELPPGAELRLLGVLARLMPPKRGPLDRITFLRRVTSDEHRPLSITLDRRSRELLECRMEKRFPHVDAKTDFGIGLSQ